MPHNTHRLYPLIAVALLAAGTTWLDRITSVEPSNGLGKLSPSPDAVVDNARVQHFDKDGRLQQVLESISMRHFPADGRASLVEPRLLLIQGRGDMRITADHGEVTKGGDEVLFTGNVHGTRRDAPNAIPLLFESASLLVRSDTQQASTSDPVVFRQGSSEIHGLAMQADNLFGTLQIQGSVRATIQGKTKR